MEAASESERTSLCERAPATAICVPRADAWTHVYACGWSQCMCDPAGNSHVLWFLLMCACVR